MRKPIELFFPAFLLFQACALSPDPGAALSATDRKTVGGILFARIPAGEFLMGFSDCGLSAIEECPRHPVSVSAFWMGVSEGTVDQFVRMMGYNPSKSPAGAGMPVANVSWNKASEFCRRF